ncbi:hypothetical protein ACQ4PT_038117 [Festuca glaucescens]
MAVDKSGGGGASSSSSSSAASTVDRFLKIVLSWDYLRLVADSKVRSNNSPTRRTNRGAITPETLNLFSPAWWQGSDQTKGLKYAKNSYASVAEYLGVFEPLLFEEVKAQIVQGRSSEEDEIGLDWQRGVVDSCTESEGFHKVAMVVQDGFREIVSENDLLLLSKEKFEEGVTPIAYAFAVVEQRGGKDNISLRTFLAGEIKNLNVTKPVKSSRLQRVASTFSTPKSLLWVLKMCSLSTILREFSAMHSIASLPFKDLILSASDKNKDGDDQNRAWNVPERLMDYLQTNLNGSQLEAVNAGLSRRSFVLIQVFSTLSFSGSAIFSRMTRAFDVVIIDEAAQAVGDPVQLPATVISKTAQKLGYATSLFQRFQAAGFPVQMLKIQYRMHPEISIFPSKEFYEGILQDGEGLNKKRPWHSYSCFGPFCFFDIDGIESQPSGSGSWVNEDEVEFITLLYHQLAMHYPELKSSSQVALISPYRHQVKLLKDHFKSTFGDQSKEVIDVNTVDGFQGREKEVVIFSCVRCNKEQKIGFVNDFRRMNVAITRARSAVLVIGSASTLQKDEHWNNLVESAKERNHYFKVSKPFTTFFAEDNFKTMKVEKPPPPDTRISQAIDAINEVVARQEVMDVDDAGDQADGEDYDAMEADDGGGDD